MASRTLLWIPAALLAAVCFGAITIAFKLLSNQGVSAPTIVGGTFGTAALMALPFFWNFRRQSSPAGISILAGVGVLAYFANVFQAQAIAGAPSPGLPPAIIGAQSLVVSVLSTFLWKTPFSAPKVLGLVLIIIGVLCLSQ